MGRDESPQTAIRLADDARENGLASMLADLVRQNLEAKPHKRADFDALAGNVAIVAEDVDVALTLCFERGGSLVVHDGVVGVPDVTIRGPSEVIMALSTVPLTSRWRLPLPPRRDEEAAKIARFVASSLTSGKLHLYGGVFHVPLLLKLTRVMTIHG